MSAQPESPRLAPGELDDPERASAALLQWERYSASDRRSIASHPQNGPRLARLIASERWLAEREPRDGWSAIAGACPAADELYDFGRGPGYDAQDRARRVQIEEHVAQCADCAALVATLATPPPLPLSFEREGPAPHPRAVAPFPTETSRVPAEAARPARGPRPTRAWPRIAAAAAAVLVTATLWYRAGITIDPFPAAPLLRGEDAGALRFPRERVLAPSIELAWAPIGRRLAFEVAPQHGATEYRVEISRHSGGAFEAGERVRAIASAQPRLEIAPLDLAPGHYTWRAWAVVRGLDEKIGERDFEVVADAETASVLSELADESEPGRSYAAIRELWNRRYYTDAREIARALPSSLERDAFLERTLGR